MDNKQDRQFYWNVKDFISNPNIKPAIKQKSSLKDVSKTILEQNKVFKQTNFISNTSTINMASQTIDSMSSKESSYKPQHKAYTKNSEFNPFNHSINEQLIIENYLRKNRLTLEDLFVQYAKENGLYEQYLIEGILNEQVPPRAGGLRGRIGPSFGKVGEKIKNFWNWLRGKIPGLKPSQQTETPPSGDEVPPESLTRDAETPRTGDAETPKSNNKKIALMTAGAVAATTAALGLINRVGQVVPSGGTGAAGGAGAGVTAGAAGAGAAGTGTVAPATSPTAPKTMDDLLDDLKRAKGMPVPLLRPRGGKEQGNYSEWRTAVDERNAAIREANIALERERKRQRGELKTNLDAKTQLGRSVRERWASNNPGMDPKYAPAITDLLDTMTPEEKAEWDRLSGLTTTSRSNLDAINQATSNEGLANTLRQQAQDRAIRAERNKVNKTNYKPQQSYGDEETDPITGDPNWDGRYLSQGQREKLGSQNTQAPSSSNRGVNLSADTPDWVRRHAEKYGEESAREIEAMRLGATSVLQGDPTQPMDYSMSADEVMRRGRVLDRDRRDYAEQNPATTSGRQSGIGIGKTASQPESTWDEVARKSVQGDSELANAPLVRRNGRVYAQTANGEIELSTGSMNTSQYASNAPTREELNRRTGKNR